MSPSSAIGKAGMRRKTFQAGGDNVALLPVIFAYALVALGILLAFLSSRSV